MFAEITKPLHKLTERSTQFNWTNECQGVFEDLHGKPISTLILAFPNYTKSFILDSDAIRREMKKGNKLSGMQADCWPRLRETTV